MATLSYLNSLINRPKPTQQKWGYLAPNKKDSHFVGTKS